ncbi:MAG TPA: hypothetical protein VHC69_30215 [Polyangiaceae bacterium]|nr:hypothetical protein [Polyangiaceae bacterium]
MQAPELQTILTLTSGSSGETTRTFRWGTPVPPVSVGTEGEWRVDAPGVLGLHLYVAFDGRMVHVAAAEGARATVRGAAVARNWTRVPVRTEVRFGEASIAVTCEEATDEARAAKPVQTAGFTAAAPPCPGLVRTMIVREPKPVSGPPGAPKPAVLLAPVGGGRGGTQPLAIVVPATRVVDSMASGATRPVALPAATPKKGVSTLRPVSVEPPAPAELPSPAAADTTPQCESAPSTMFDGGALRDHAYRIASMPPEQAHAAAEEYAALLKQRAGRHHGDPPALSISVDEQGKNVEPASDAATPPDGTKTSNDVRPETNSMRLKSRIAKSWKETSNVKKAILFLLPFAAAAVLLDQSPVADQSSVAEKEMTRPSAVAPKHAAVAASKPAPSAPVIPSAASSSRPVARAVVAAAPSAVVAAAPSAVPAVAIVAPSTVPAVAVAVNEVAKDKAMQADTTDPDSNAFLLEHRALAATFGGNLKQAASLYEKLAATKPEARLFALAARLTKEGAVRSP